MGEETGERKWDLWREEEVGRVWHEERKGVRLSGWSWVRQKLPLLSPAPYDMVQSLPGKYSIKVNTDAKIIRYYYNDDHNVIIWRRKGRRTMGQSASGLARLGAPINGTGVKRKKKKRIRFSISRSLLGTLVIACCITGRTFVPRFDEIQGMQSLMSTTRYSLPRPGDATPWQKFAVSERVFTFN